MIRNADKLVLYARVNYGVVLTLKEATHLREKYFDRFAGLRRWHALATRDGAREHIAKTLWGRLRFLDGEYYTEYLNHPVQGSAADGLKRALRCVYERLKRLIGGPPCRTKSNPNPSVKIVHHVHDEIITEALDKDGLPQRVKHELEAGMVEGIQPLLPHVPAAAEGSIGKTWAAK